MPGVWVVVAFSGIVVVVAVVWAGSVVALNIGSITAQVAPYVLGCKEWGGDEDQGDCDDCCFHGVSSCLGWCFY